MYQQLSERTSSIPLELELENGKKLEHMYPQLSGKNIPLLANFDESFYFFLHKCNPFALVF